MEDESLNRAEAERLLSIASKFLESRDLPSSKDFALLAQETAPLLDGSDLILAVTDVLLAAAPDDNKNKNWYSILQLSSSSSSSPCELDLVKKEYRRLALLLHPDKNNYPFADEAFRLVKEAWSVLSDPDKKRVFDSQQQQQQKKKDKLPVRKQGRCSRSFWTACPYCYNMYEYPRVYVDCCLKCGNCGRAMHAAEIGEMPPMVEGKESYYCCWGFFPLGFKGNDDKEEDAFGGEEERGM